MSLLNHFSTLQYLLDTSQLQLDTIEYQPLNDKETLMNYYGKTYLEMRNKLSSAPDVSPDQAHQAAMDFVNWIPKSFFGDKPLP